MGYSLLPADLYHRLPSEYRKAVQKLEKRLDLLKSRRSRDPDYVAKQNHKLLALDQFSNEFFMLPELWKLRLGTLRLPFECEANKALLIRALNDFCYWPQTSDMYRFKLLDPIFDAEQHQELSLYKLPNKEFSSDIIFELSYPNKKLQRVLRICEQYSSDFLPKRLFTSVQKLETMYQRIKRHEGNLKKWISCLKEVNDTKFIQQNMEYRISKEIANKKLWKLYLYFLNEEHPQELPRVLSAYCRLFVNDRETTKQFHVALKNLSSDCRDWKKTFPFEERRTRADKKKVRKISEAQILELTSKPMVALPQTFKIPMPIVTYLLTKVEPRVIVKLQQSAKYFLNLFPIPYCQRFNYWKYSSQEFVKHSWAINSDNRIPQALKLNIVTSLFVESSQFLTLSRLIQNHFNSCTAKYITIEKQKITKREFEFLIGHGGVELLVLNETEILEFNDEEERLMVIEEVLVMVPKVRVFEYRLRNIITFENPKALATIPFVNKIEKFHITKELPVLLDAESFCTFLKNSAAPCANIKIEYSTNLPVERLIEFKFVVDGFIDQWRPANEKPRVDLVSSDFW